LIQLLVAIRRVYRQNWLATLFKFALGTLIYAVMLSIAFGITAFVTLALPVGDSLGLRSPVWAARLATPRRDS